jgi:hypothetical protein
MSNPWNLARLLGDAHATFFRDHWERAPLVLHPEDPARYAGLLSVADLDTHVFGRNAMHPAVSLTDANRKLGPGDYTYASGLIDNARAAQHFAEGATMIFAGLEGALEPLAALCRAMEAELSVRFQTNVYRTPGNAQGFQTHYDSHDVFALQVQGKKLWTLYDTPVALPFRRQEFHPREVPVGEVTQTFTLGPGDLAYVPRGVLHDARNVDGEDSLHITLGVLHTSWTDLIAESLARFGLRDTEMRRGMPPGFAREGFDRAEARERFRALLRRFAEEATFDDVMEHFAEELIGTRHPILPGQIEQVRQLDGLTLDREVITRPSLLFRLKDTADGLSLMLYGSEITFPAAASDALRACLRGDPLRIGDLPGLDDAGRLVLVRRLVREGVLTLR